MRRPHRRAVQIGAICESTPPALWPWVLALIAILFQIYAVRSAGFLNYPVAFGLVILVAGAWVACGGSAGTGGGSTGGGNAGTPSGTYTLTVTGTHPSSSTTLTHNIALTLTVN